MASLEEALVPMYLLHRYQLQAAAKFIGGQYFSYAMRGDGQVPVTGPVVAAEQERALQAILGTLQPEFLSLAPVLLQSLPPRPPGYPANRELFARSTGDIFDPLAPAQAATVLSLQVLLNPQRAARSNRLRELYPSQPPFTQVLERLVQASWKKGAGPEHAQLQQQVNSQVLQGMIDLAANPASTDQVRAQVWQQLDGLDEWLQQQATVDPDWQAHYRLARALIKSGMGNPLPAEQVLPKPPPGSPIGSL